MLGIAARATARDFGLGNSDLVVRLGPDGGLREIGALGAVRARAPANVPVVGTLEIVTGRPETTVDAASLEWSGDWLPGTNVLALRGKADALTVDLRAFLVPGKNFLALRYVVSGAPASLRYVMRFDDGTSEIGRTARMATIATNRAVALGVPRIGIGADPPGAPPRESPARTLALQVDRHAAVTFYVGIGEDATLDATILEFSKTGVEPLDAAARARDREFLESGVRIVEPAPWGERLDRSLLALRDAQAEDGAFPGWRGSAAALALDLAGHSDLAARFCRGRFERGDADAAVVFATARHGIALRDGEFLEASWPGLRRVADGDTAKIDATSGLLVAADDWISSQPGFALSPNAEVVAGLRAAALVAETLGREGDAARWRERGRTLAGRILTNGFDRDARRFVPRPGFPRDDRVDSALLNVARYEWFLPGTGAVGRDEPRLASTLAWIERTLLRVDGSLSAFEANPRGFAKRDGDYDASARATAWLAEVDCLRGWTRQADLRLTACLAIEVSDAPDESVAALMGFLACVRPDEVVMHLADRPRVALRNVSIPGARVDLEWERASGGRIRVTARARGDVSIRMKWRLAPLEGEVIDSIDAPWSRDGRDALTEIDVPPGGERSLQVGVRIAVPYVRLDRPERWRSPCIILAGNAPRPVKNAAESLREALAIYANAGPILVNFQSLDIGLAGRDVIVVGDPRDQPRLPDEFRDAVAALPDAPAGPEEYLLVRGDDAQGNLTVLAGRDDPRLVLAIEALTRHVRDAALGPLLAGDDARLADRARRLDSLAPGVVREWLVSGPLPLATATGVAAEVPPDAPSAPVVTRAFGELRCGDAARGGGPSRWIAQVSVRSSTARDGVLWIGTSDAAGVHWNDKLAASLAGAREWRLDTDRVPVKLAAGWNRLLVSVATRTGSASLSARLTDAQGTALTDLEYRASIGR